LERIKVDNLAVEIKNIWEKNKAEFEERLDDWLKRLEEGEKLIRKDRKQFHQWDPLRVYVSVTKAKSSLFSLRFFGQEVAELFEKDGKVITLRLNKRKRHSENNSKYFRCTLKNGDYDWRGQEAREFRSHFGKKAISSKGKPKVGVPEHRIESKFIQEMLGPSGKFGVPNLKIRPVTIAGCPLQFPTPISASKGRPKKGYGNIDILARHLGRLSVWELKKPNTYNHAASQAYIYALTLLYILRHTKNGARWYRLFGYERQLPKRLVIEAVVGITRDKERSFNNEKGKLERNTPFEIGSDRIALYTAYYQEGTHSITLEEDPFRENQ